MSLNLKGRSSLSIHDFSQRQMLYLFDLSRDLKRAKYAGTERGTLRGKEICLIFERTSTRTGCAFEVAAHDQGAHVTHFDPAGSQIGHKESMKDTARVLGRMFDANEFRGAGQKEVEELAKYAGVAERFGDAVVQPFARRTARLQSIVHHLGLGSADARARLARRLLMPVSKDTLLRLVRPGRRPSTAPRVVGIEGWAWKRDHRYGTIVCDFERHEVVDVLADREAATVEAWLTDHPGIEIVSRDRGGGYGQAVARVLPEATQVADRWHLMRMRAGPSLTRCGAR